VQRYFWELLKALLNILSDYETLIIMPGDDEGLIRASWLFKEIESHLGSEGREDTTRLLPIEVPLAQVCADFVEHIHPPELRYRVHLLTTPGGHERVDVMSITRGE
jgi:hypothetical protein